MAGVNFDKIGIMLLTYAGLLFPTVFILSFLSLYNLEYYMTAFGIEFFLVILVTSPYNQAESRRQMAIGAILITIFVAIVIRHLMLILK